MSVDFLFERMVAHGGKDAVIADGKVYSFSEITRWSVDISEWLVGEGIPAGSVVSLNGDYTAETVALILALMKSRHILVPLSRDSRSRHDEFRDIVQDEYHLKYSAGNLLLTATGRKAEHPHYAALRQKNVPGLVLFTSGSTGKPKGIVQDLSRLAEKFRNRGRPWRMLIFLQLDHIGGINSLLYCLANGGAIIVPEDKSPAAVCEAIEWHRAELLPTSPTFLNLMLLSREYEGRDLSSLKMITYGTEPMPVITLTRLHQIFPGITLKQTYGMTELGILGSRSRGSDSLWIRVGGDGFRTKIVGNTLRVKSDSAMLGYLNAPDPFDADGFLDTGDIVEQDGEWIRIKGRQSEIINVGGLKVHPAEVESVLLNMPNIQDAVVFGEAHPVTGQIVAAKVRLLREEAPKAFKIRMRRFAADYLQPYQIPARVYLVDEVLHNERFKRVRRMRELPERGNENVRPG